MSLKNIIVGALFAAVLPFSASALTVTAGGAPVSISPAGGAISAGVIVDAPITIGFDATPVADEPSFFSFNFTAGANRDLIISDLIVPSDQFGDLDIGVGAQGFTTRLDAENANINFTSVTQADGSLNGLFDELAVNVSNGQQFAVYINFQTLFPNFTGTLPPGITAGATFQVSPVPLPAGVVLLLTALGGLGFVSRRRRLAAA